MTAIPPKDAFESGEDAQASARVAQRDSLFLVGTLTPEGTEVAHPIRIRNLSATGMMAEGKFLGQIGQIVVIEIKALGRINGSIAWVTDGRMGIAFANAIDPQVARQPVGKQVLDMPDFLRQQSPRRPGLSFKT
jgi:hypothetical protein